MTDIPLRDQISDVLTKALQANLEDLDAIDLLELVSFPNERAILAEVLTSRLLGEFDIQLRSPHPTPDANEEGDQPRS